MFEEPLFNYTTQKHVVLNQFLQQLNPRNPNLNENIESLFSKLYIEELVVYPNRMAKTKRLVDVPSYLIPGRFSKCTEYTFKLPYTGDSNLFKYHGTRISYYNADIALHRGYIEFQILDQCDNAQQVKQDLTGFLDNLQKQINSVNESARQFNNNLKQSLEDFVSKRLVELANKHKEEELAGLPPDEEDVEGDITVPLILKPKLEPHLEQPLWGNSEPNYVFGIREYDQILSSITHCATYMETHNDSFKYMEEEHIRDHILSMLNGMLEIRATGETFNGKGKTDILYPYKEKNIFIAECKVWHGQSEFVKAIDQLEGYLGWNDTKTALIIFYRNKESMYEKIIEMRNHIKSRNNFRACLAETNRGGRFLMDHPQDCKKSYYLELIVFNFG